MLVNKIKINLPIIEIGTTATTVNVPINLEYQLVDQSELIETVFVDTETEKAINPIYDYEKVRFSPINLDNTETTGVTYNVKILMNGSYVDSFGEIGFTYDDIKYSKEIFKQTFLNLAFYDTANPLTQNLISYITLFPLISKDDLNSDGTVKPVNNIPLTFNLQNPILFPKGRAEGFYLYDYKGEFKTNIPKDLYMRASFNNAKTGKLTNLMVVNSPQPIDKLINELYTKYTLTRTSTGYYYKINTKYLGNDLTNTTSSTGNNVTNVDEKYIINLYQINTI